MAQLKIKQISGLQTALDAKVSAALFDANTILIASEDNTPAALSVSTNSFIGRTSGGISSLSVSDTKTLLNIGASDLALASGNFFIGNTSGVAAEVAKSSIPLSGFGSATSDVSLGTTSARNKITNLAGPVDDYDAVNKKYVTDLLQGGVNYRGTVSDPDGSTQSNTLNTYADTLVAGDMFRVNTAGGTGTTGFLAGLGLSEVNLDVGDFIIFNSGGTFDHVDARDPSVGGTASVIAVTYTAATESYTVNIDAAYAGQTSITTVGTISGGTWQGTAIGAAYGGTGLTTYNNNGLLVGNTSGGLSSLAAGSANTVLKVDGSGNLAYGSVDLTNNVTGTLPIANGGTGLTTYANQAILVGNTSGGLTALSVGSNNTVLRINGGSLEYGAVNLTTDVTGTLPVGNGGTGSTTLTSNGVIIGAGTGALTATAAGSQYNILTVDGSGVPSFGQVALGQTAAVSGTLPVGNGGTGATTFTSKGIVYGNGGSALSVTAAGSQYNVLVAGADGTPSFGQINLGQGAAVTGTLATGNGGTGLTTYANQTLLVGNTSGGLSTLAAGSNNTVLKVNNSGVLAYASLDLANDISGTLSVTNGGTGLTSFAANAVMVGNTSGTLNTVTLSNNTMLGMTSGGAAKALSQSEIREVAQVRQVMDVGNASAGSMTLLALSQTPLDATKVAVFFNGIKLRQGASYDYTISAGNVVATNALNIAYGGATSNGEGFENTDVVHAFYEY